MKVGVKGPGVLAMRQLAASAHRESKACASGVAVGYNGDVHPVLRAVACG